MKYDYTLLEQKLVDKKLTHSKFAFMLGMKDTTLHNKLHGVSEFKQSEIMLACRVLNIPNRKIDQYFFVNQVQ